MVRAPVVGEVFTRKAYSNISRNTGATLDGKRGDALPSTNTRRSPTGTATRLQANLSLAPAHRLELFE